MAPALVSVSEAASYLGIGRTSLYALVKDRKLRCVRVGQRTRFAIRELDRFIERNSFGTARKEPATCR